MIFNQVNCVKRLNDEVIRGITNDKTERAARRSHLSRSIIVIVSRNTTRT